MKGCKTVVVCAMILIAACCILRQPDCIPNNGLPDPKCTPGAADPKVTRANIQQTICVPGYTEKVRPPVSVTNKIKAERMKAYEYTDAPTNYELDHLIPLELGGCPDCVANLWPEPYNIQDSARIKDKLENRLHKLVCNGTMTLEEAQMEISTDWSKYYDLYEKS